jgi:tetratricopeptide (TPR) repeat protein
VATIYGLLERKIDAIVDGAGSARTPGRIVVGTPDTAINAYAELVNVERPVRATQRLLRLVNYVAEVHFVAGDDKQITAALRIRDSNTLELLKFETIQGQADNIEALLDEIAKSTVGLLDPYILTVYMYENAMEQKDYQDLVDYAKRMIPVVSADLLPWYYNLLGQVAAQSGDADLAIAYYREAIGLHGAFYLAYINWGRALAGQGRQAEAIELYSLALGIKDVPIAHVYAAEALTAQQQFEEALAELAAAEALAPEFAGVYAARATVFERLDLPELANRARLRARTALLRQPRQNLYDTL